MLLIFNFYFHSLPLFPWLLMVDTLSAKRFQHQAWSTGSKLDQGMLPQQPARRCHWIPQDATESQVSAVHFYISKDGTVSFAFRHIQATTMDPNEWPTKWALTGETGWDALRNDKRKRNNICHLASSWPRKRTDVWSQLNSISRRQATISADEGTSFQFTMIWHSIANVSWNFMEYQHGQYCKVFTRTATSIIYHLNPAWWSCVCRPSSLIRIEMCGRETRKMSLPLETCLVATTTSSPRNVWHMFS